MSSTPAPSPASDATPPAGETPTDDGAGEDIGELTLGEYFQQMDALQNEGADAVARATQELEAATEAAETEEEVVEAFREFMEALLRPLRDFLEDVGTIVPPPEVEDEHNEMVAAEADLLDPFQDVVERAQNAESVSDAEELMEELDGPVLTPLFDREIEACVALQAVADANGISVDVCVEE